ncbi:MAG: dienelactone hydrolase family protein [Verrucomicrobiales bacterium]|nr:dienelactone hydrolase family protein [Verrucomicrobiales bacterium]
MNRTLVSATALAIVTASIGQAAESLPGTALLDWTEEDPSVRIMDGAHAFVERKIAEAAAKTPAFPLDEVAREASIRESRASLARKLGVVDERLPSELEFIASDPVSFIGEPGTAKVAEGPGFQVYAVRWEVLPGFSAEGLYVNPIDEEGGIISPPLMVLLPDADETPEDLLGMTPRLQPKQQIGLRFAMAGFRLIIPVPVNRSLFGGLSGSDEAILKTSQSHREWIYRQAFQMGRHPLGYEVQSVLSAIDWFEMAFPGNKVSVAGYGEGGRAALYAAALDPRIDHAFVSGAFSPRDAAWSEPIHRNLFNLLPEHGDASVAALIAPRVLLVEHTAFPEVADQKGGITTPPFAEVEQEWKRIGKTLNAFAAPPSFFLNEANDGARGDSPSVAGFLQAMGLEPEVDRTPPLGLVIDERSGFDPAARHQRIFLGMEAHVQSLVDASEKTREEFFFYAAEPGLRPGQWSTEKEHPTLSPMNFMTRAEEWRTRFENEIIGTFSEDRAPLNPRTRKLKESEAWTMWEVGLDIYPELEAWGVLLVPKGIEDGERRPMVVCQHGRHGVPRDCIDAGKTAYNDFAARLAERGYITFSPHNLYRHEDRYRWLDRKANLIGGTLFSFIVASHRQQLDWLKTLPEVDPDKIAFYGLSYGGETAVRVPAVIPDYCLSICSGDFNHWTRKVADPDFPGGFMKSIEWEMPYWNLGNTFDYGEMAALIFPRPFFVERGHHDLVSTDAWVAHEYARVRHLYARFGLEDRTEIEFFQGGHSINGAGSFEFLDHHLKGGTP